MTLNTICYRILLFFWLPLVCLAAPAEESLDQIMAVVNQDIITQSQFNQRLAVARQQVQAQQPNYPLHQIKTQVLNQLIIESIQMQMIKQRKITVSKQQVDQAIAHVAEMQHLSVAALKAQAKAAGYTTQAFRESIKQQLLFSILQHQALANTITVTEAERQAFKKKISTTLAAATQFQLTTYHLPLDSIASDAEKAQALRAANTVAADLRHHRAISDSLHAGKNNLPKQARSALPDLFAAQLGKAKTGDIIGPIRAPNGYHILQVTAVETPQARLPSPAQIDEQIKGEKFQAELVKWFETLRKHAYVNIVTAP
jgi:peptidyl-prolyl cis-trans isomerase SurA